MEVKTRSFALGLESLPLGQVIFIFIFPFFSCELWHQFSHLPTLYYPPLLYYKHTHDISVHSTQNIRGRGNQEANTYPHAYRARNILPVISFLHIFHKLAPNTLSLFEPSCNTMLCPTTHSLLTSPIHPYRPPDRIPNVLSCNYTQS